MNLTEVINNYKNISGIYCITSPSGKTYIGSAIDLYKRMHSYKSLNCKSQTYIYNSLVKYGIENHNFEVICLCDKEELIKKEQMFIDFFRPDLNICKVAGSTRGRKHTDETKKKLSSIFKGRKLPPRTDEHKRNISLARKGKGRPHSEESKAKIAESNRRRKLSEESKQKISDSLKKYFKEKQ